MLMLTTSTSNFLSQYIYLPGGSLDEAFHGKSSTFIFIGFHSITKKYDFSMGLSGEILQNFSASGSSSVLSPWAYQVCLESLYPLSLLLLGSAHTSSFLFLLQRRVQVLTLAIYLQVEASLRQTLSSSLQSFLHQICSPNQRLFLSAFGPLQISFEG